MVQLLWAESAPTTQSPIQSFVNKTKVLHRALKIWQMESIGPMERNLQNCNESILFLDKIEEHRRLTNQEFRLRNLIRERAYHFSNNIELKWRQRSRCRWVAEGDRNTRYFHSIASSRQRRNMILELEDNGRIISDNQEINRLFADSMMGILGVSNLVLQFDAKPLYPINPDLSNLQAPFTEPEIERAVMQLANHKASGPDGLPNEFIKNYWQEIKSEICRILDDFYENRLDLNLFNEAKIVLIPKIESPKNTSDFKPISVLNLIPKLISKILSNRLRLVLPELISANQTAFVHGRQISENFVTTRELLHHVAHEGKEAVFVKIDFRKAFDSIEWSFLKSVMAARRFPIRWINWMSNIWSTSSSRICINGDLSEPFHHKRGLRQGDPLSPMLFNIAVDVFQQMIQVTNRLLPSSL